MLSLMNRVLFQIGVLAFCISVIILINKQYDLIDVISTSFIISVGMTAVCALMITVLALFATQSVRKESETDSNSE